MEWLKLPTLRQKFFSFYILLSPFLQVILLAYIPFTLWVIFFSKVTLFVSLYSFIPLYLLLLQLFLYILGFIEFNKSYNLNAPWWFATTLISKLIPYQLVLAFASIRAFYRSFINETQWEKTKHINLHRNISLN